MKKTIALSSVALSALFAVAVANATENAGSAGTSGASSDTSGSMSQSEDSSSSGGSGTLSRSMIEDQLKSAKTCTSESTGKTYKRGQTGFKSCQQEVRRRHEQMSGSAGSDTGMTSDSSQPSVSQTGTPRSSEDGGMGGTAGSGTDDSSLSGSPSGDSGSSGGAAGEGSGGSGGTSSS